MQNFNNSYPYNYNSYTNNMYNQQTQMNQYAFVNGIEGAKSFRVQSNQTVLLMDNDNPVCYMKQANSIGQATLRYFKLVEVDENTIRNLNVDLNTQKQEYVLKSDFEALVKRIDEMTSKEEVK